MSNETIRKLSYILSNGPGSLLEISGQSVLIHGPDNWEAENIRKISNSLLEATISDNGHYELVNLDLSKDEDSKELSIRVHSEIFPKNQVCPKCKILYNYTKFRLENGIALQVKIRQVNAEIIKYNNKRPKPIKRLNLIKDVYCMKCTDQNYFSNEVNDFRSSGFYEAIVSLQNKAIKMRPFRYVGVCNKGHIFDIDLNFGVHENSNNCTSQKFRISDDYKMVSCLGEGCGAQNVQMKDIFIKSGENKEECSVNWGNWLEYGDDKNIFPVNGQCGGKIQFSMKGDKKVWYSVNRSALNLLNEDDITRSINESKQENLKNRTKALVSQCIRDNNKNQAKLKSLIKNTFDDPFERFFALRYAKRIAVPPDWNEDEKLQIDESFTRKIEFLQLSQENSTSDRIDKRQIKLTQSDKIGKFVNNIQIIEKVPLHNAIIGLSRGGSELSDDGIENAWTMAPITKKGRYPTVELVVEGFLINFKPEILKNWAENNISKSKDYTDSLSNRLKNSNKKIELSAEENLSRTELLEFYLLHSLAHFIIGKLAFSSGYNIMGLRERLYFFPGTRAILVHTTDGDEDGSLGGVAFNGNLPRLTRFFENIETEMGQCANDPVCTHSKPEPNNPNFAACHACLILPETSCEFLNKYLDRNTLAGSGEGDIIRGFFKDLLC